MADFNNNGPVKIFFISPIGKSDSDIRRNADHLRTYVIDAAINDVRMYKGVNIEVVRGDDIQKSGQIDKQVIDAVRNADICIADITGYNINVMMEIGMAIASDKCIIYLKSNQFDAPTLADLGIVRYIDYGDPTVTVNAAKTKEELVKFVKNGIESVIQNRIESNPKKILDPGVNPKKDTKKDTEKEIGGSTIDKDIYNAWLDDDEEQENFRNWMIRDFATKLTGNSIFDPESELTNKVRESSAFQTGCNDPDHHLRYALANNNMVLADCILDSIPHSTPSDLIHYLDFPVQIACQRESDKAGQILIDNFDFFINNKDVSTKKKYEYIGVLVSFLSRKDREGEFIDRIERSCLMLLRDEDSKENKASLYCQLSRIYYGVYSNTKRRGYLDKAAEYIKAALKYKPNDPSYLYNLAGILEDYDKFRTAKKYIDKCMANQKNHDRPDEDHLFLAYRIYYKLKLKRKANEYLQQLEKVDSLTHTTAVIWTNSSNR